MDVVRLLSRFVAVVTAVLLLVPTLGPAVAAPAPATSTARGDTDGDGLDDAVDGCPTVASATATGCPSASRSVSVKWLAGKQRLQVQVFSSVAGCSQRARIALFRVRPAKDYKAFGGSVSFSGRLRVKVARGATYYVTVPQSYASGVAECGQAISRKVSVPRS
jgi:hypothetical protein